MSKHAGQFGMSLQSSDVNTLLATFASDLGIIFKAGCLSVRTKLPMGLAVTLVAIPRSSPEGVVFSIPFDQIRGDKTGGMASMLAGGLWGLIKPFIEKRIKKELAARRIPEETVTLSQSTEGKVKVGQITLHLRPLNAWLIRQPPAQGFKLNVDSIWATEEHVNFILDLFHDEMHAPVYR